MVWAFIVASVAVGIVVKRRQSRLDRALRDVERYDPVVDGNSVRSCGFRMRQPPGLVANRPLGRLHVQADRVCVRSVVMGESGYCVDRQGAHVRTTKSLGIPGVRFVGSTTSFDVFVDDQQDLLRDLGKLGLDRGVSRRHWRSRLKSDLSRRSGTVTLLTTVDTEGSIVP